MPTVAEQIEQGNEYVMGHIYALEDRVVRELFQHYRQAYLDIKAELDKAWQLVGMEQWNPEHVAARDYLLGQIVSRMRALDPIAAEIILAGMIDGYRGSAYGTAWNLDTSVYEAMVDKALVMPLLPVEAIRAQLLAPYLGKTFVERFQDKRAEFELRIKNALIQSQIDGDGIYGAQKRIAQELGVPISRRTKADRAANKRAFYRTAMIARSELIRASNTGALAVYQQNEDVLQGWEFIATLDERTCPICAPLDGQRFTFESDQRKPPIHPNCRCSVLPWLINQAVMDMRMGKRQTFVDWAQENNVTKNEYGQIYDFAGKSAPKVGKEPEPAQQPPAPEVPEFKDKKTAEQWALDNLITDYSRDSYYQDMAQGRNPKPRVNFRGIDLDIVNATLKELARMQALGIPKLRTIEAKSLRKQTYTMAIAGDKLYINTAKAKNIQMIIEAIAETAKTYGGKIRELYNELLPKFDQLDPQKQRQVESIGEHLKFTRFTVGDSVEDIVQHEMGHLLHNKGNLAFDVDRRQWINEFQEAALEQSLPEYRYKLSEYPFSSPFRTVTGLPAANYDEVIAESFNAYMRGNREVLAPKMLKLFERYIG